MGANSSKTDNISSVRKIEAKTYDELSTQVESIAFLASYYKNNDNHFHLTFRIEPRKEQLEMPAAFYQNVFIIVTTVPDLPDFWECRLAPDGRAYYVNHANRTTQWSPPWSIPYAPILAQPPVDMIKRLSYYQWSMAYSAIQEAIGDPIALAARLKSEKAAAGEDAFVPPASPEGEEIGAPEEETDDFEKTCTICMDREIKVVLPCMHAFCAKCIGEWRGKKGTCPVCHASLDRAGTDDWVLASEPSSQDLGEYVTDFINAFSACEKDVQKLMSFPPV